MNPSALSRIPYSYMEINKEIGESFSTFSDSVPRPGIEPGWVAPLVFETSASTDSAIWASVFLKCDAKVQLFFVQANFLHIFLKKLFVFLANPTKRSNFASRLLSTHTMGERCFRSLSYVKDAIQPIGRGYSVKRVSA